MDEKAITIVADYIKRRYKDTNIIGSPVVHIVWKAKIIQNWKYLLWSPTWPSYYFEATYNGDKKEWYLDIYMKRGKEVIPDS